VVRKSCFVLGLALAALWAIGLALDRSASILWFDAVAAIVSFGVAALVDDSSPDPARAFGPAFLAVGLGALFIIGASTRQPIWATWLNLLFAIAYIGVAIVAVNPELAPTYVRRHSGVRGR
jgi:hypothetical protein